MLKSMLGEGGKKFLNKNKNFNASIYKYNVYYGITITNDKQNPVGLEHPKDSSSETELSASTPSSGPAPKG